jgi:hypothetical protein
MDKFASKCPPEVYFHREVLCHSLEGRPMPIYTLTWDPTLNSNLEKIVAL